MKMIITAVFVLGTTGAEAGLSMCQTLSPAAAIQNRNPAGAASSETTATPRAGTPAVGMTVGLGISGGYRGNLYAFLVAPNGMLMNQSCGVMDGFGATSSEMYVIVSATGETSIQSQTGGYAVPLAGTHQVGVNVSGQPAATMAH